MQRVWKGLLAGMLACLLLAGSCWAAPELAGLSDEELSRYLSVAQEELDQRPTLNVEGLSDDELLALIERIQAEQRGREDQNGQQLDQQFAGSGIRKLNEVEELFMGFELAGTGERIVLGMPLEAVEPILGTPDQIEESVWRYRNENRQLTIIAEDGLIIYLELQVFVFDSGSESKLALFNGIQPGMSMDACAYAFGKYWEPNPYNSGFVHFNQAEDGQWTPLPIDAWPYSCTLMISTSKPGVTDPIAYVSIRQ